MIKNTKKKGVFRWVSLGDIHLGHPNTPTKHIIHNLNKYCTNDDVLKDVDLLIFTGDVFDRMLQNASDDVRQIERWITLLLFKCSYLNVAIRIVEGTPSHDREQSSFFVDQAKNVGIDVDIHYSTTLSIEHMERFGITILYVPDKWRNDNAETLREVKTLLKEHQLDQVDFAIMHGAFEYQLPPVVKEPQHSSDEYLRLVKYFIMIGHVHLMTRLDRILAAGSYDRICHGEEGAKGYYDVSMRFNGEADVRFVENKGAKKYVTVHAHEMDTKEVNVLLKNTTKKLPKGSAIRIKCLPHDSVTGDLAKIAEQYPDFQWTVDKEVNKKERKPIVDAFLEVDLSEFESITPDSISRLLEEELSKHAPDPLTHSRCLKLFEELKGDVLR